MTLAPLLQAGPAIQIHAFSAMSAFALGGAQLLAPKGTLPHRALGWIWVTLMLVVCISSLFIHELRRWGAWSPIHLLTIFTLVMLPLAVLAAHRHEVARHRGRMIGLFVGALLVAGLFAFWPGRIMHAVVFGPASVAREPQRRGPAPVASTIPGRELSGASRSDRGYRHRSCGRNRGSPSAA